MFSRNDDFASFGVNASKIPPQRCRRWGERAKNVHFIYTFPKFRFFFIYLFLQFFLTQKRTSNLGSEVAAFVKVLIYQLDQSDCIILVQEYNFK